MRIATLTLLALAQGLLAGSALAGSSKSPAVEQVKITTEDKLVLVADLYRPPKAEEMAPAALLVHNAGGARGDLAEIAERLAKQGFAVLVPDLRGHGQSVGPQSLAWQDMPEDEQQNTWAYAMRDLRAAADFLRKDDRIHASNLSMLGYMAGSTLATRHALRDENVRCIVLLGPQAEQLGFDLQADLEALAGLPTYIGAVKETQGDAEFLAVAASDANGGLDFVQIEVFKALVANPVEDKRMPADIAKWMMDQAVPKKGKTR
jgi:alpha-beta hydrolase superfamily lysophospholipase